MDGHIVEIRREPHATQEDVVAHIIGNAIAAALGFLLAQVALDGYLGSARHVAGKSRRVALELAASGSLMKLELTSWSRTCREAWTDPLPTG